MAENAQKLHKNLKGEGPNLDLGLRFAIAILLGAGGGYWLDTRLHSLPLFLIIGLILGATSGFLTIYRAVYPKKSTMDESSER